MTYRWARKSLITGVLDILQTNEPPDQEVGYLYVEGDWTPEMRDTLYFEGEDLVPRPKMFSENVYRIAADDIETVISEPAPAGTLYRYYIQSRDFIEIPEGETLEFGTTEKGEHVLDIRPPLPWRQQEVMVIAS